MFNHISGEFVQIDDARIYYEEAGNKSGAPLLFLHGGFGTLEDFKSIVDRFVSEYRLIAIDGRGQGKSTLGSKQLTYRLMMEDAEKSLITLVLNKLQLSDLATAVWWPT